MPFKYEFYIDNEKLNGVEMGFSTSRKWEEALDESRLIVPFSYLNNTPYKMYSLLTINIGEFETYAQVLPTTEQNYYFLVYSDKVDPVGAYGYYKHTVSAIEYTAKLDAYIVNYLAQSRSIIDDTPATFQLNTDIILNVGDDSMVEMRAQLEPIDIKATYRANEVIAFPQVAQSYWKTTGYPSGFVRGDAVIKTNALLISGNATHILSNDDAEWVFPVGQWYIEYGFNVAYDSEYYNAGYYFLYRYYINVIDEYELSIYDVVNEIRTCVSKFGGIEDTVYFETTRIFDIDPDMEDYLKSVQAPQIYLSKTTARKMLIYVLAFVNALPRLEWTDYLDILKIETYNLTTGLFEKADVIAHSAVQNTNQIGTRNYQHITQALANDLDEPSIYAPSQSGFQQVRSLQIQITANNFGFHLPKEYPLYMPKHLYVKIPNITIRMVTGATAYEFLNVDDYELDLMPRFINGEYWKLKEVTANFPTVETTGIWDENIGMRENMVDNLSWNMGDTTINLSEIFGTVFQSNLITNVVTEMAYEQFITHLPGPITPTGKYGTVFQVDITLPSNLEYKDWQLRLEYITDERLVIKQDKADLSQILYYSEMQQNQEESLVNILRQSRKGYGDLQRTGNVDFSFVKIHKTFDEFYEVGQVDSENYTISQIDTHWFNDYAIAKYSITKHYNRIQQATYVNQKYRPFDNFAKSVLYRHEHYGDYLIAMPPNDTSANLQTQTNKIYSNDNTIHRIVEIMLGDTIDPKVKATVALIRTDGMFEELQENYIYPYLNTNRYFIAAPVSAKGIKGGFAFTFGFQGNQSAGDGLVQRGSNWYNQAVRYTDTQGRFTRFGFAIVKDYELDSNDSESYPLVTMGASDYATFMDLNGYFWCGGVTIAKGAFQRPLVWNKDPLTNANLTYQLSVISYYMGLYIFGIDFFSKNFLVNNPEVSIPTYLYLYSDSTIYQLFEDIYVKSGYSSSVLLTTSNIEYDSTENLLSFIGISMTGKTSWAIGRPSEDGSIKLLVACNEALGGIQFVNQHFRPGVDEIGSGEKPSIYEISLSDTLSITSQIGVIALPFPEVVLFSSLSLNDTITVIKSTDFEITLSDTLSISSQISTFTSSDYNIQLTGLLTLTDDITVVKSTDFVVEISDLLTVASTISVTAFQYIVEELITTLTLQDSIDVIKSTDFVITLSDTLTINSTVTHLQFIFPIEELQDEMILSDNIVAVKSTDFVITLSDTLSMTSMIESEQTAFQYVVRWYHYDGTYHDDVVTGGTNSYAPTVTPYTAAYIYAWPVSTIYGVTENTTVTETRTIRTYLVTFDANGGSPTPATQYIAYGESAITPTQPTRTSDTYYDYAFSSWSPAYTNVTANITTVAQWTVTGRARTLTYDGNNGTPTDASKTVYYESAYGTLTTATRTNYTLTGWFTQAIGGTQVVSTDIFLGTGNITLYAQWALVKYTVTFYDWNDYVLKTEEVEHGSNATPPTDPTRTGYTFTGWSVAYTNVTSTVDTWAQYSITPETPTLTFVSSTPYSLSFTITNNSPYTCTMHYDIDDDTPDSFAFSLGSGLTSSLLTIDQTPSGYMTPNTEYTIYALAKLNGISSGTDSFTETTPLVQSTTPTINTPYKTTTWRYTVDNNDASTATIYSDYDSTNPPTTSRGSIASGGTTSVINTGSSVGGFTIYAQAQASGEALSDVVSEYVDA